MQNNVWISYINIFFLVQRIPSSALVPHLYMYNTEEKMVCSFTLFFLQWDTSISTSIMRVIQCLSEHCRATCARVCVTTAMCGSGHHIRVHTLAHTQFEHALQCWNRKEGRERRKKIYSYIKYIHNIQSDLAMHQIYTENNVRSLCTLHWKKYYDKIE